jgi:hypothetical protein
MKHLLPQLAPSGHGEMSAFSPLLGQSGHHLAVGCDSTQCVRHSLADALAIAFLAFG